MKRHVVLNKEVGDTPLATLRAWKEQNPEYKEIPASYAGRLDPMASGKLLILLGEECKKQDAYTNLDKEYEIEVLLDVGSDTGDALGLVTLSHSQTTLDDIREKLPHVLEQERGTHTYPYPVFSSKTVAGKPLFLYALEGALATIQIPTHPEHIYRIHKIREQAISTEELQKRINAFLTLVPKTTEPSKELGADFRINEVRESWKHIERSREFVVLTLRVVCGSGTYMRSLAPRLGIALGTSALALSIYRSKIGRYWHGMWIRGY